MKLCCQHPGFAIPEYSFLPLQAASSHNVFPSWEEGGREGIAGPRCDMQLPERVEYESLRKGPVFNFPSIDTSMDDVASRMCPRGKGVARVRCVAVLVC